jgi:hypothetical protein
VIADGPRQCFLRQALSRGLYESIVGRQVSLHEAVDPRVVIAGGSLTLWAGRRPKLLSRVRLARLRPDFRSTSAVLWTAWAASSPGTLRVFLKLLLRLAISGLLSLTSLGSWCAGSRHWPIAGARCP